MPVPLASPANIRKPESVRPVQRHAIHQPGASVGLAKMETPKDMMGPKRHRNEVLRADQKSKLWSAPKRPPPTEAELQKVGADAIAAFINRLYGK